ncbi:hypothetical protein OSB04_un000489 [Centaurea solstitialis]|uniref:Reverse transcriptase zinc-binding domain-containing protein n=1 Tax=Centaurea solstitialis TaxID=347529 RepID=A0AA38S5U8_9ASTR|nr:hypothetical protein OSB04_un000489 [Centaurea solstitialis]
MSFSPVKSGAVQTPNSGQTIGSGIHLSSVCFRSYLRWKLINHAPSKKDFCISNRGVASWTWSWVNTTKAERLANKVDELENMLKQVELQDGADKWNWEADPSGEFTVSSLRSIIDSLSTHSNEILCFWNNWMPPRVNCFIWRGGLILLLLCALDEESVDHLFHSCSAVKDLWRWFFNWCMIDVGQQASLNQLLQAILERGKSIKWRKFLETAVGGLILSFNGEDEFQATLFSCMKYRANCKFLLWQMWSSPSFSFG